MSCSMSSCSAPELCLYLEIAGALSHGSCLSPFGGLHPCSQDTSLAGRGRCHPSGTLVAVG